MKTIVEVDENDLMVQIKDTIFNELTFKLKIEHLKTSAFNAACLADVVIFDNGIYRIVLKDRT